MTLTKIWVLIVIVAYLISGFLGGEPSTTAIIIWILINTSLLLGISDKLDGIENKLKGDDKDDRD